MPARPGKTLETFPNPEPGRDYIIEIETPEFTCLCPRTGQPDFATLAIEYVPDRLCVELKSLKLYIWAYRDEGHFHEQVTNAILGDLVAALEPRYAQVRAAFYVRGGIYTTVTAEHRQRGWSPPPPPPEGLPRERQSARDAGAGDESAPEAAESGAGSSALSGRRPAARAARPAVARGRAAAGAAASSPSPVSPPARDACIGIDLGITACRVIAVDAQGKVLALAETPLAAPVREQERLTQDPGDWWKATFTGLRGVLARVDGRRIRRIAVAGTSGTLLLSDAKGQALGPAILPGDRRAEAQAERIAAAAPEAAVAPDPGSSLAKLLWLHESKALGGAAHALHGADWISGQLTGVYGRSDAHNCLRLGYDPLAGGWPAWLRALGVAPSLLPQVHEPGEPLGRISGKLAQALGLPDDVEISAGTSDGVAAFLAAGASEPGHGVTALGNTLALKVLSAAPVVAPAHGVYSHRLGRYWLAGGASNSGGHVLRQYFTPEQMREMTPLLDPDSQTDLDYYPLTDVGERFPVNDPRLEPQLEPLPGDSVVFFQGMLEGIARIEAQGYAVLAELGAPPVTAVWTTGGGSLNPAWTRIRGRTLGVPLKAARSQQPAYGAALLAAGVVQKTFA